MKKSLFGAVLLGACVPLACPASPTSQAASRAAWVSTSNLVTPGATTSTGTGDGSTWSGGSGVFDPAFETWAYPSLTRLVQDLSARRTASAEGLFLSLLTTLQVRANQGQSWSQRYLEAWRQVSTAQGLMRQGHHASAADLMQVLLNHLRSTAALSSPFPQPGTGTGTGNGWSTENQLPGAGTGTGDGSTLARSLGRQTFGNHSATPSAQGNPSTTVDRQRALSAYQEALLRVQSGDMTGARQQLLALARDMQAAGDSRAATLVALARSSRLSNRGRVVHELIRLRNQAMVTG